VISVVVWVECAIIGINQGRCPLTDWAARFTADRAANFDIYLPLWLAQYNKLIFGTLFFIGEFVVAIAFLRTAAVHRQSDSTAESRNENALTL
jgi:hypothetical protein